MTERRFRSLREASWQCFEALLTAPRRTFRAEAARFPAMLRALTGDLNTAKANGFDPVLIDWLNRLVLDGSQKLRGVRRFSLAGSVEFLVRRFPSALRAHWRSFAACWLLFYGIALFSAFLCVLNPDAAANIIGYRAMRSLEQMYDPQSERFLVPREVTGDADMFGYYVYNNTSIAFRTFAGGVFAGIGSLVLLVFNAVFLGAAAGHIVHIGFAESFFSFTSGHSAFELTGIVLSAQAGFLLGYRFFVPRGISRAAALREAGKSAFPLVAGAAVLIFLAAIIEAFWSSRREIEPVVHYAAGAAAWALLAAYFAFSGRGGSSPAR